MTQVIPRFDYRVEFGSATDVGVSRSQQEDALLTAPELGVFAVADGMGGHAKGEVASATALDAIGRVLRDRASQRAADAYVAAPTIEARRRVFGLLKKAVEAANAAVRERALADAEAAGMGSTLDIVWLIRNHAFVAHAGDGRVYLARPTTVVQLTQDHELVEALRARGTTRIRTRPKGTGNRLMNAVGLRETVVVDTLYVDLQKGDRLLLCTDGVHGQIDSESDIATLLRQGGPADAGRALVGRAAELGRDNATAIVVAIHDRFVRRPDGERGLSAVDLERARQTPLLDGLPLSLALSALAAAVEVELPAGASVPRAVANDFVCYLVLDGIIRCPPGRQVSTGAVLFAESLVLVSTDEEQPVVEEPARLLRLRADDFREVCASDSLLAAELYQRLATHLARVAAGRIGSMRPRA